MDGWVTVGTKLDTKTFDAQISKLEKELEDVNYELENATKFKLTSREIDEYSAKAEKLKNRIIELRKQKEKVERGKGFDFGDLDNVNDKIKHIIKSVAKWGLAIFSIRSAYSLIRRATSTLSQYNQQLANDLSYIQFAIATALKPIIEYMIKLAYKLLQYVNYIAKAWFNVDLFAKASSKDFANANSQAKKLSKTMAGFDEMNILQDNGSVGIVSPSIDLGKELEDVQIPKWLQWLGDNKDLVADITKDVLLLFGAVTVGKILSGISTILGTANGVGLLALGKQLAIIGSVVVIAFAIKGLVEVFKSIDEYKRQLNALTEAEEGTKRQLTKLRDGMIELYDTTTVSTEKTDRYANALKTTIDTSTNLLKSSKLTKEQKEKEIETIKLAISYYSELYNRGELTNEQQKEYKKYLEKTIQTLDTQGKSTDDLRKKYEQLTGQKYETSVKITAQADTKQAERDYSNFWSKLGTSISTVMDTSNWGKGFTSKIKSIWSGQKYADGGIINLPGRGVPIGAGAIGGEAGMEGIIPMENTKQMELLGSTIGKYVTISLTNITKLDNREIAREQRRINNQSNFATNR